MNPVLLEEVLACPSLPSLPAVAVRVIELTSDPQVNMDDLASTIQNDQGLSAKVLRTVNSSFYALRTRCSSINKALVLLGLGPVKSLALGFSLVTALKSGENPRFDYVGYWRRGVYTAVSAKVLADALELQCGDEAFLGGLLQDVGMMALLAALKNDYLDVVERAGPRHTDLARLELEAFELQHADIGAMLCKRWRLPDELSLPVKYHERPTAAPTQCLGIVRCVALGNLVHDVLTDPDPVAPARRLYEKAHAWLELTPSRVDEIVARSNELAKEMAELLELNTGARADAEQVMQSAANQLLQMAKDPPIGHASVAAAAKETAPLIAPAAEFDPVTGLLAPAGFDATLRKAFAVALSSDEPLALVHILVDRSMVLAPRDPALLDELAMGIATLAIKQFEPAGGFVARLDAAAFTAVLPGVGRVGATKLADAFREDCRRNSKFWSDPPLDPAPTVSLGIAAWEPETSSLIRSAEHLMTAVARGAQAAQAAGGDCLRAFIPKPKAA